MGRGRQQRLMHVPVWHECGKEGVEVCLGPVHVSVLLAKVPFAFVGLRAVMGLSAVMTFTERHGTVVWKRPRVT